MKADVDRWFAEKAEKVLREAGIREGQIVLDFGCGSGYYTIPAARIVGDEGRVYALDQYGSYLREVRQRAERERLENIQRIETSGELEIPLKDESVDVVLLYDVLHSYYFTAVERKELLTEIYRISKPDALISVYPKHMNLEDIRSELEKANFHFVRKLFVTLLHDEILMQDYLLNFRRRQESNGSAYRE
jgi:ubiquinone/menaquinone biosynthesis C-methylase UbiE